MQKNPKNCSRFFGRTELLLKYDFLFIELIFCTIINSSTFKRCGIIGKPRKIKVDKSEFENSQLLIKTTKTNFDNKSFLIMKM